MASLPTDIGRLRAVQAKFRSRRLLDPRAFPAYLLLTLITAATAATVFLTDVSYDGTVLNGAVACLQIFLVCALCARWLSFDRAAGAAEAIVLMMFISLAVPLAGTLLASTNLPLADRFLANLDRVLFFGFDRRSIAGQVEAWPDFAREVLRFVYHSLQSQPVILLAALFATRQQDKAWTFVTAWTGTLVGTLAVFPFFPAFGSPPYEIDFAGTLEAARNGSLRTLGINCMTGLVFFPSFHAAAAVLLGWGFWSVRGAAAVFIPLNVLMFASALFAGSHYLVDLFAGAGLAWISIILANRVHGRLSGPARTAAVD